MGAPTNYFVDHFSGFDDLFMADGSSDTDAWATVAFALENIPHDASNGTQILIKGNGTLTDGQGESVAIDPTTMSSGYSTIGAGAPLIFRGYTSQDPVTEVVTYGEAKLWGEFTQMFTRSSCQGVQPRYFLRLTLPRHRIGKPARLPEQLQPLHKLQVLWRVTGRLHKAH